MPSVLIVDDEPLQRDILSRILGAEGYDILTASSGEDALEKFGEQPTDIVLTDLKMEGMDGIDLMEALPPDVPKPTVIIMTAHGSIASAVEAVSKGAFDYLTKPLEKDVLLLTLKRASERADLLRENRQLQKLLFDRFQIDGIVGTSEPMRQAVGIVRKVSGTNVTVLITGESGTGKELVARAIHYNSPRRARPFTALNCAALPETLFESELFGYEPGAFSGAVSRKEGLLEQSDGGTVFLDEIGELPQAAQSKLLRFLQDREVRRLGGKTVKKVDVRIIAATNKDLQDELREGTFREDLFFRLRVVTVPLPPLRDRIDDIPELVAYFVRRYSQEFGRRVQGVDSAVLKAFTDYSWPGNIRQLESVVERAILMNESGTISPEDIRGELFLQRGTSGEQGFMLPDEGLNLEELEQNMFRQAMTRAGGNASKAARLLGMNYKAFLYRLDKFDLK